MKHPLILLAILPAAVAAQTCKGPIGSTSTNGTILISQGQAIECRLVAGQSQTVQVRQYPGLTTGLGGTWATATGIGTQAPRYVVTTNIPRVTRKTAATPLALSCPSSPVASTYCAWRLSAIANGFSVQ